MAQPYSNLASTYPNLSDTNAQASKNILSKLRGELSPEARNAIQDASATYGIEAGIPGSQAVGYRTLRDVGRSTMDVQDSGLNDYLKTLSTYSGTLAPGATDLLRNQEFRQNLGQQASQFGQNLNLQKAKHRSS